MELTDGLIEGMPRLIQAGMGARISGWRLANATARLGALGVVSSVGLRHIAIQEMRAGDTEVGAIARRFPIAGYAEEFLSYAPGGRREHAAVPIDQPDPARGALPKRLSAVAAYVEVTRARAGHRGPVGINVMWKCALTVLPSIYGAMLAGVDALLCGAGVPMELPDIVDRIRRGEDLRCEPLYGTGTPVGLGIADDVGRVDGGGLRPGRAPLREMPAPKLLPILSNYAFPKRVLDNWERERGGVRPFAFVLENHAAGGHNAPPRNKEAFGDRDDIDAYFDQVKGLGVPVYVAGAFPGGGSRTDLLHWVERGAYGIQVGSRFALCAESGMRADLKRQVIGRNAAGSSECVTDLRLSPTGYPFKYVPLPGTLSDPGIYRARRRACNRGYLMQSHFEPAPDGSTRETYVCPAMPRRQLLRLGGSAADAEGRVCLCNALLATAGLNDATEPPLVTLGASGLRIRDMVSAREVVEEILGPDYVREQEAALDSDPPGFPEP